MTQHGEIWRKFGFQTMFNVSLWRDLKCLDKPWEHPNNFVILKEYHMVVHFQGRATCEKAMISKYEDFRCMPTQMRTIVLVYKNLLNCVILFRQMLVFIFQHHGASQHVRRQTH